MSGFRLLDLVKFFLPILPEIESPLERVSFDERIVFTVASGIIFLLSQLPIYGLVPNAFLKINDPFYFNRSIFAMEKGTLLELGLLPVVTASLAWQLAAGLRLVKVNFNLRSERELFQTGQKLTAFALAVAYAVGLILTGYYDNVIQGFNPAEDKFPPVGAVALILLQIVGTSVFITLMVEIFDKGFGFGSGFLSFIALQVATNLIRDVASFESYPIAGTDKFETFGSLANALKSLKSFSLNTNFFESFTRTNLPNLNQLIVSILSVLVVIGLQNMRIELPIRSTKVRGMANVYPIRLLYTGALPIVFAYAVLSNIHIFGFILANLLNTYTSATIISSLIGKWAVNVQSQNLELTSGALYFLTPATSLFGTLLSPIRSIVYSATIVGLSCWFANIWSGISGSSPRDIAKQFKEQGITISSKRDISITKELSRVIPVASVSGAFVLAATSIAGDLLGGLGKGVGAVVGISAAFGILEDFMIEFQQNGGASQFGNAIGGQF
ncbi:sec sixty-one protein homolog [[Candida] anglica]|uniref:Sec sixty-one protein homolog n=1 Tax=[Candida] anglica TaxID=148631 RepID=A0ABP0EJ31_9ASCO